MNTPIDTIGKLKGEIDFPHVWAVKVKPSEAEGVLRTNEYGEAFSNRPVFLENYTPQKIEYKAVYIERSVEVWNGFSMDSIQEVINKVTRDSVKKSYENTVFQGISKVTLENNIVIDISFMSLKDLKTQGYL